MKGENMKRIIMYLSIFYIVAIAAVPSFAQQQGIMDTVGRACMNELETYCTDVSPGEGRILACLYANEDKLSGKCEYALYEFSRVLEHAVVNMSYMADKCQEDLKTYCSDLKPSEGRLLQCMDKNSAKVSARCKQALGETKLK